MRVGLELEPRLQPVGERLKCNATDRLKPGLQRLESVTDPGRVIQPSSPEIPDPADRSARLQPFGEIARGGQGAVLKGRDSELGRDLASEILVESHRDKSDMIRRFIEEAQIAGQLQHPGIVRIYKLGAFGERRPCFAMRLTKGHTLAELLGERGRVSAPSSAAGTPGSDVTRSVHRRSRTKALPVVCAIRLS